jgi:biopolymer transport protein TolR
MLVLLVIFMVTAPLVTPAQIELPSVQKSSQAPVQPIEIIINAEGKTRLRDRDKGNERDLSTGEIVSYALERQAAKPGPDTVPVVISADKNVRYESVLAVMDALQKKQVQKVGLTVKPVPAK